MLQNLVWTSFFFVVTSQHIFSKNKYTAKILVGIIPSREILFVSQAYEGSISDKKLVGLSGLLDKLEAGDELMAD